MKIRHERQTERWDCGHACAAMVLGIGLDEAKGRIGWNKPTHRKHLARVIPNLGPLVRKGVADANLPKRALVRVLWLEGGTKIRHWVVKWAARCYDPWKSMTWEPWASARFRRRRGFKMTAYAALP